MEDKFNTVNLQAALAEGVQDYIEEELHHEEQAEELNPEEPEKELPTAPEEVPEVRSASSLRPWIRISFCGRKKILQSL